MSERWAVWRDGQHFGDFDSLEAAQEYVMIGRREAGEDTSGEWQIKPAEPSA